MSSTKPRFVVCISNEGYATSLHTRTIYRVRPDPRSEARGLTRLVDESGEAYLYPSTRFVPIALTPALQEALGFSEVAPA